jgi:4-hydroxy-3-methylbut-2-enyl diphosphate reductase
MEVIRAEAMGFCFGVRDALALADSLAEPESVTVHGELVHNERVLLQLGRRGFRQTPESDRAGIPETPRVLITAHGISQRERARLIGAGKSLIDATCPLVTRVHEAAQDLARRGYFIVVIGRPGHAEVEGIVGDLERFAIVVRVEDVRRYPSNRIGVVCQSTTPPALADVIHAEIEDANRGAIVEFHDTICRPTKDRQRAVVEMLEGIDALVVVGGRQSHNTRQLAQLAADRDVPVLHVQSSRDLDPAWFADFDRVGLTAGTSTPDDVIDEIESSLLSIDRRSSATRRGARRASLIPHV